jgi:hypothetical protein
MTTDDVKSLLGHVIKTIDHWWDEITNLKSGYFTRSYIGNSSVTYKNYVEWRYSELSKDFVPNYASIFISLDYEDGTDYIQISLKKMKDGVYTEYDPFCEIHDGKTEVVISEQTGFGQDNTIHDILTEKDFNVLTDNIATTVYKFVDPSCDEEEAGVNMDEASKTLTAPAGLTTKEIFVLDTSYFVIGDIYLLEIDPIYDWSKISTTPIKVPRWVYAICEDVCSTVIDFMLGGIEGRDQLFRMQVHADEIESGMVTVKRVLMNETLIQDTDEECS